MENFDQQQSGGQMPPYFNNDTRVMSVSDWRCHAADNDHPAG